MGRFHEQQQPGYMVNHDLLSRQWCLAIARTGPPDFAFPIYLPLVAMPQWIGQSKIHYLFLHKIEGGMVFDFGSYRDHWNPNLNGDLRTFDVYVGRTWLE